MELKIIGIFIGLFIFKVEADFQESTWQKPNAWERHSIEGSTLYNCQVCSANDDYTTAVSLYKKLVAHLFNKNHLKENETTGQFERAILFSLTAVQLEALENIKDIRDVDSIVTNILATARVFNESEGNGRTKESASFGWLIFDIIKDCFQLLKIVLRNPEARFVLQVVGILMLLYFIHKRYAINFIIVVLIFFFIFGYFYTYFECNRKLEADKMIDFVKNTEGDQNNGFLAKIFNNYFRNSDQDKNILEIRKKSKLNLPFCRPDHVLLMYVNEMFLDELQLVIEKCTDIMISLKDRLSFWHYVVAMIILPFLIYFTIQLAFKYLLNPTIWYNIYRENKDNARMQQIRQGDANGDRISGENLKRFLLALQSSGNNKLSVQEPCSGVQELAQCIEGDTSVEKKDPSPTETSFESNYTEEAEKETKS